MKTPQPVISPQNLAETTEMKRPIQYHEIEENLSEWQAARLISKTWSMEQD